MIKLLVVHSEEHPPLLGNRAARLLIVLINMQIERNKHQSFNGMSV